MLLFHRSMSTEQEKQKEPDHKHAPSSIVPAAPPPILYSVPSLSAAPPLLVFDGAPSITASALSFLYSALPIRPVVVSKLWAALDALVLHRVCVSLTLRDVLRLSCTTSALRKQITGQKAPPRSIYERCLFSM
jgi:hypothetical protein